jgi:hypothetical protein
VAKYLRSGGGRHRPVGVTGGMRAGMAAADAAEKMIQERIRKARDHLPAQEATMAVKSADRTDNSKG